MLLLVQIVVSLPIRQTVEKIDTKRGVKTIKTKLLKRKMWKMRKNENDFLRKAKKGKNDEFYTQLSDIEKELRSYTHHFKDKVVYCNCDDPITSNFYKYFAINFKKLGLKKLIASCYVEQEFNLFNLDNEIKKKIPEFYRIRYCICHVCMLYFKSHECENCFHANIRYNRWKRIYCLPTKRLVKPIRTGGATADCGVSRVID